MIEGFKPDLDEKIEKPPKGGFSILAEREGFEPSMGF